MLLHVRLNLVIGHDLLTLFLHFCASCGGTLKVQLFNLAYEFLIPRILSVFDWLLAQLALVLVRGSVVLVTRPANEKLAEVILSATLRF